MIRLLNFVLLWGGVALLFACDYDVKKHEAPTEPMADPPVVIYNVTALGTCRADTGGAECTDNSICTETTGSDILTVRCFTVEWCAERAATGLNGGCKDTAHQGTTNITGLASGEWIINQETTASDGIIKDQEPHRVNVP